MTSRFCHLSLTHLTIWMSWQGNTITVYALSLISTLLLNRKWWAFDLTHRGLLTLSESISVKIVAVKVSGSLLVLRSIVKSSLTNATSTKITSRRLRQNITDPRSEILVNRDCFVLSIDYVMFSRVPFFLHTIVVKTFVTSLLPSLKTK